MRKAPGSSHDGAWADGMAARMRYLPYCLIGRGFRGTPLTRCALYFCRAKMWDKVRILQINGFPESIKRSINAPKMVQKWSAFELSAERLRSLHEAFPEYVKRKWSVTEAY